MNTNEYLELSTTQIELLRELANASLTPKIIAIRSQLILLYSQKMPPKLICEKLGLSTTPVYKWRKRWLNFQTALDQVEKEKSRHELKKAIISTLQDAPRCGGPPRFSDVQTMQIIALACSSPEAEGLPVSQWSCRLLARHAQQLGIVDYISFKQVSVFLKSRGVKTS